MRVKVSSKNEFEFIPDFMDNLELPKESQFKVYFKRLSKIANQDFCSFKANGEISVDVGERLKASVIKFVNAPILELEDGKEKEMTIDMLIGEDYPELFDLQEIIIGQMNKIFNEGKQDTKK